MRKSLLYCCRLFGCPVERSNTHLRLARTSPRHHTAPRTDHLTKPPPPNRCCATLPSIPAWPLESLLITSRWSCGAEARQFMAIRTRCGSAVVRTASRGRVYRIYHIEALSQTVKFERNCHLAEPPSDASLGGVIRTHRARGRF